MSLDAKIAAAAVLLERIQDEFGPATLASSLGAEDMVLTDLVAKFAPGISIFSLDTGRLNPETYDLPPLLGAEEAVAVGVHRHALAGVGGGAVGIGDARVRFQPRGLALQRDRHGLLGVVLSDDVAIQFRNDLRRREIGEPGKGGFSANGHSQLLGSSTVMLRFV